MRQDWAAGWARYLQPGANLVCLAFPIDPERQTGPPWPVDVATYKQLLLPHGERELGSRLPPRLLLLRCLLPPLLHASSAITGKNNLQDYLPLCAGFACVLEEPVPPEMSHPGRGGKECLLVFERR
jgi:hypothetical protein